MKKLYFIKSLLVLLLILFSFTTSAQVDLVANVDVTPPLSNGQTFNYTIMSTGPAYVGLRIKLVYDPAIVKVNSLTPVYTFDVATDPIDAIANSGLIKFEGGDLSPISSDIDIFSLEFEVLDNTQTINIAHNYDMADGTVVLNNSASDILGTANDIILTPLSIDDNKFKKNLSIYPNPVKDELFIKVSPQLSSKIESLKIYTIEGKLVESRNNLKATNGEIEVNISGLRSSLYFMTITSEDAQQATFKILVK